jgi:putative transcriptional regulator
MRKKRNLFSELMEGFDALADQRAGKRVLRTHTMKPRRATKMT